MQWLNDVASFLLFPALVLVAVLIAHRGSARKYQIIRETNSLGESCYEVWFEYYSIHGTHGWLHKETFPTQEQAKEFIAQQCKTREVVEQGKL